MVSPQDCHIIAIANQKGGVGKTTTAVNIATALAAVGKRVLLIDGDSQGNASSAFGLDAKDRAVNLYHVMIGQEALVVCERKTMIPGLYVVPSTVDLAAADVELANMPHKEEILRVAIAERKAAYDYIIIDTPPSLGLLTVNTLVAATSVLIPMQCEYYALEGLAHLLHTIDRVTVQLNPQLEIYGVLCVMVDGRNRLTREVQAEVRGHLGDAVFDTVIPRNVKLSEAPSHGKPAIIYDLRSSGSMAYLRLAREILARAGIDPSSANQQVA